MGLKDLFSRKRTPFEELWKQIEGIPNGEKNRFQQICQTGQRKNLKSCHPKR